MAFLLSLLAVNIVDFFCNCVTMYWYLIHREAFICIVPYTLPAIWFLGHFFAGLLLLSSYIYGGMSFREVLWVIVKVGKCACARSINTCRLWICRQPFVIQADLLTDAPGSKKIAQICMHYIIVRPTEPFAQCKTVFVNALVMNLSQSVCNTGCSSFWCTWQQEDYKNLYAFRNYAAHGANCTVQGCFRQFLRGHVEPRKAEPPLQSRKSPGCLLLVAYVSSSTAFIVRLYGGYT